LLLLAVAALAQAGSPNASAADLARVTSHITYEIRPDRGVVRVLWDVTFLNNDPSAVGTGYVLPVLNGAEGIAARSAGGKALSVAAPAGGPDVAVGALVRFEKPLPFGQSYDFKLEYSIPEIRRASLLVTPGYAFLPVLASGDEATVVIDVPAVSPWTASVEPGDCARDAGGFSCSGSDSVYLVATAEVSNPDLAASLAADVQMRESTVSVAVTYFQGEDAFASHLRDLVVAGLPIIEDLYGFPYSGPATVNVAERGRQVILGYEGLTTCGSDSCDVAVSPIADDHTVLHELAHLWSGVYGKRWLAEGFAQLIAREAAPLLPAGLLQGPAPQRDQPSVELQLDAWAEVTTVIGADEEQLARENAGYYRSLNFLSQLTYELGLQTLQKVNRALADRAKPADSRDFMDALEEASGRSSDDLFLEWVFPSSYEVTLGQRREARDRLESLSRAAASAGLSEDVPAGIRDDVGAWRFGQALTALDQAEAALDAYEGIRDDISPLQERIADAGLTWPPAIDQAIGRWDFDGARATMEAASWALGEYLAAVDRVEAPRGLWTRFGLIGQSPEDELGRSLAAFNGGDFASAVDHAVRASEMIDDASQTALRRSLIVAAGFGLFAVVVLAGVWISHLRAREFA
jgi:hypothetical protein